MSISYVAKGATASPQAASITVGLPTGYAVGDLLVAWVGSYHPTETPATATSGWSLLVTQSGGAGSAGTNTGPRRLSVFTKIVDTVTETTPTFTISSATGSYIQGRIWLLQRTGGTGWLIDAGSGADDVDGSGGGSFSVTCSAITNNIASGDLLIGSGIINNSAITSSGTTTMAASGATVGTANNVDNIVNTTMGYRGRYDTKWASVTAGSSSAGPVYTAGYDLTSSGAAVVIRLREATGVPDVQYSLTTNHTLNTTTVSLWTVDSTTSDGTTTLTQLTGTTASISESPTGVFTITNPAGTDDLTFRLRASITGVNDDATITLVRSVSVTALRPAIWAKTATGWM